MFLQASGGRSRPNRGFPAAGCVDTLRWITEGRCRRDFPTSKNRGPCYPGNSSMPCSPASPNTHPATGAKRASSSDSGRKSRSGRLPLRNPRSGAADDGRVAADVQRGADLPCAGQPTAGGYREFVEAGVSTFAVSAWLGACAVASAYTGVATKPEIGNNGYGERPATGLLARDGDAPMQGVEDVGDQGRSTLVAESDWQAPGEGAERG